MILELRSPIEARVETTFGAMMWLPGIVIGHTFEANPRYDVELADGRMVGNLPAERVRLFTERRE